MTLSDCLFEDVRIRSDGIDMILVQAEPRVCGGAGGVKYKQAGKLRACVFRNVSVAGDAPSPICDVVVKGRSAEAEDGFFCHFANLLSRERK